MKVDQIRAEIQRLIAADRLKQAIEELTLVAEANHLAALQKEIVAQSAQLQHWDKVRLANTESPAELARGRNRVVIALLDLTDQLPSETAISSEAKDQLGVSEDKLKKRLFWLLLVAKLVVIGFAGFLWSTRTFSNGQFFSTVGILLPIFMAYLVPMSQHASDHRAVLKAGDKRVNRDFARRSYLFVVAYAAILLIVLNLRGPGTITFEQMTMGITLAESGLGLLLSKTILDLYRNQ